MFDISPTSIVLVKNTLQQKGPMCWDIGIKFVSMSSNSGEFRTHLFSLWYQDAIQYS